MIRDIGGMMRTIDGKGDDMGKKFTFKKHERVTGLNAIGAGTRGSYIKLNGEEVGSIKNLILHFQPHKIQKSGESIYMDIKMVKGITIL